ncbi:MAG: hypothetical protein NVS3B7_13200 [Candidatus Elarobacter sp.]
MGLSARGDPFYGMGSSRIDIGPILLAGRPMALDQRVEVPPFSTFTFPQPAHVRLDLRRVDRGLQIDGIIEAEAAGSCDRCLDDVVVPLTVDVEECFDPPSGTSDPFGENNVLNGTDLDVGDLVRQLVTSALPYVLTCSESCRGLCGICGRNKNAGGGCICPQATTEGDHGEPEMEDPPVQDT